MQNVVINLYSPFIHLPSTPNQIFVFLRGGFSGSAATADNAIEFIWYGWLVVAVYVGYRASVCEACDAQA